MFASHGQFLQFVKELVKPQVYLEIGVESGYSLFAEPMPPFVVGVDPGYRITVPIRPGANFALFRKTSDAFFAEECFQQVSAQPVDLTFVDGLHWAEFALRDVLNAERLSHRNSAILVHDIYAKNILEAGRVQRNGYWMGDIFKIIPTLKKFRPDLSIACIGNIPPSGMAIIWDLDPNSNSKAD